MHPHDGRPEAAPPARASDWSRAGLLRPASDWFTTADALGDALVPTVADWCAVHVRGPVVNALRAGDAHPLADLGLAQPVDGELLEMITLRHRDAEREPVIRLWAAEVPVRTGDAYGAGRVTATGITRYLPHVPPGLLQAAVTDPRQRPQFERLGVASSIVVPLRTSTGAVLGAMTLLRELDAHDPFTEHDVRAAEQLARSAAEALEASRITTVTAESVSPVPANQRSATWRPQHPRDAGVSTEGRNWARRTLPEILTRQTRRDLYEDMDLVFTELISNAVRHGGGLCEAQLSNTGDHLRLTAADNDPRSPAIRKRRTDQPNVLALAETPHRY
ncbi:GAF domain-containing protein [Actinoplanes sp. NPDC051633]|uniref:GAF domain-containing protein n=1 Tax=Actinoplanes sp. NPDC051633 TaxID=3155670 RepID=UPI00342F2EF1